MNERREISFLLTVEDHIAFNMLGRRRLPFGQRHFSLLLLGGALLVLIFLLFNLALLPGEDLPLFSALVGFILVLPLVGGLALWAHPSQLPRRVRAMLAKPHNRHLIGKKTLHIGPEGITVQSPHAETLLHWDMIEEIDETDDYVFFFYAQRSAMILPRRPFPSEEDYEDFMNLARRYFEGTESETSVLPESITRQPTRDEAFAPGALRESELPTVLPVHDEQDGACRDLSFVLTVEDHIALHNLIHQRLPFWRRYLLVLVPGLMILPAGVMLFITSYDPRVPLEKILLIHGLILGPVLVVAAVLSIFMMRMQAANRARQVRAMLARPQNRKFVSEMTITITPQEIITQSMTGTSSLSWDRIHEIVVTADHAFFFHAARAALVVPKRPLQAKEFDEFIDLARKYHEGSLSRDEME
jgi:hypothetical protein